VRLLWFNALAVLCAAGCSASPPGPPASTAATPKPTAARQVNPDNIRRLRGAFPPGYEVADASGWSLPAPSWGFGWNWPAAPTRCASLADPLGEQGGSPQGLSGSGPGGIVYIVVAAAPAPRLCRIPPGRGLRPVVDDVGRTTATVELAAAPPINGVTTSAMNTSTRTVVEGAPRPTHEHGPISPTSAITSHSAPS